MKTNFEATMKSLQNAMQRHSPEILTGLGIAGMVSTSVLAVRATPRALQILDDQVEPVGKLEAVKLCWKCYIPATIMGSVSIACLVGASSVNMRRNAALATAYTLSETALKEYKNKVIETIGEKKEQSIRDAISKDKVESNPVNEQQVILTEKGNTLCYDPVSGRYFKSDIDKLKRAANDLSRTMLSDSFVSLNDFYYEIGMDSIQLGDELGWHVDNGLIELDFGSTLAEGETPCLVLNYTIAPQYGYHG